MKLTQLNEAQNANAKLIDAEMVKIGLTNPFLRAGVLAVVSKESGFAMKHETPYNHTDASRIKSIFKIFNNYTDEQIDQIKLSNERFFNIVYENPALKLGNDQPGDGYKFRGRGFNQLTGRANYTGIGTAIGVDLVNNPDQLDTPAIAAKALAYFFRKGIVTGQNLGLFTERYGVTKTSEIADIDKGATIAHQVNMGWGKLPANDPTGGYQIVMSDASSYLPMTSA